MARQGTHALSDGTLICDVHVGGIRSYEVMDVSRMSMILCEEKECMQGVSRDCALYTHIYEHMFNERFEVSMAVQCCLATKEFYKGTNRVVHHAWDNSIDVCPIPASFTWSLRDK